MKLGAVRAQVKAAAAGRRFNTGGWILTMWTGLVVCCLLAAGCAGSATVVTRMAVPSESLSAAGQREPAPPTGFSAAPEPVKELLPGGAIDWSGGTACGRGTGVLDPGNLDEAQAWLLAERAAEVVARRNLLEVIKRVRVDSDARLQDLMAANEAVFRQVEAVVRAAQARGPAKCDSAGGTVEIELGCRLRGADGVEGALARPPIPSATGNAGSDSGSAELRDFLRRYSGLLFDGSKTDLAPCLFPRVFAASGELLLDTRDRLRQDGAAGEWGIRYVGASDRIAGRAESGRQLLALQVKASRGRLGSDIVLSRADADRVGWLRPESGSLLRSGRISVRVAR